MRRAGSVDGLARQMSQLTSMMYSTQGRTLGGVWEVRHPTIFFESVQIFSGKRKVHDNAWIVRIQVGPTSECFRQRLVHEDSWRLFYILTAGNVLKYIVGHFKLM